ncbi:MAG: hypothetical protein BWX64_01814 [Acidobacteria bacterium ADurb.Bin051]|jgi:hypothetical protein|nr:MAG: hypothetical protein BWX64_01814 [Acidobacteria bacterium ADurb.Bin051]
MRQRVDRSSWSPTKLTLPAWLLVLGLAGAGSAFGQQAAESGGPPGADTVEGLQERAIRETYRAHEEAIYRSGTYIEIELSDFRTILPDEYARVRLSELVDEVPFTIHITPISVSGPEGEVIGVNYGTRLQYDRLRADPPHDLLQTLADTTFADVLEIARKDSAGTMREPLAVTSFQVTTKIEIETLRYRANANWFRLPAGDDPGEYQIVDDVMLFRPEILTGADPVFTIPELYREQGAREERLRRRVAREAGLADADPPSADAVLESQKRQPWRSGDGVLPEADTVEGLQERAIREAYRAHEEAIYRSGKRIEIELSDFRTILPGEYARVRLTELAGEQVPYTIQIVPISVSGPEGEVIGVSYETYLRYDRLQADHPHDLLLTLADMTFADVLEIARKDYAGTVREPLAVTSFQVTTKIEIETLRYRANANWFRLPAGDDPGEYQIVDYVMDFRPEILAGADPVFTIPELYREQGARQEKLRYPQPVCK